MITNDDLTHRFDYRQPTDEQRFRMEECRQIAKNATYFMLQQTKTGAFRENALISTKIEEALFWAIAAIAREGK